MTLEDQIKRDLLTEFVKIGYAVIMIGQENKRYFISHSYMAPNGVGSKTLKFLGKEITSLLNSNSLNISYIDETQRKTTLESKVMQSQEMNYEFSENVYFEINTLNS